MIFGTLTKCRGTIIAIAIEGRMMTEEKKRKAERHFTKNKVKNIKRDNFTR